MAALEKTNDLIGSISNTEKLAHLNHMVENWRGYFEEPPNKELWFRVDEQDTLCFGNTEICNIADVDAKSACCDIEAFFFESMKEGYYRILITWDFKNNIYVREVSLVLYDGSDDDQF